MFPCKYNYTELSQEVQNGTVRMVGNPQTRLRSVLSTPCVWHLSLYRVRVVYGAEMCTEQQAFGS